MIWSSLIELLTWMHSDINLRVTTHVAALFGKVTYPITISSVLIFDASVASPKYTCSRMKWTRNISINNLATLSALYNKKSWQTVIQEETYVNTAFESFMNIFLYYVYINIAMPLRPNRSVRGKNYLRISREIRVQVQSSKLRGPFRLANFSQDLKSNTTLTCYRSY